MRRLDHSRMLQLGDQLGCTERQILETVAKLQLASHAQMAALIATGSHAATSEASKARRTRRLLQRLTELGLLARLERRVGGLRAGSAGFVYYLGPAGQRLISYWRGQGLVRGRYRPEPSERYVRHRLAVSQLYVDARGAAADGELELLAFDGEPDCWRTYVDNLGGQRSLKPDAFVRLARGAYEDRWFVEVDLATESRSVVARKVRAYLDYFLTGSEQAAQGVFPRVLLLANTEERKVALVALCARLPAEEWHLFTVATLQSFRRLVVEQLDEVADPASAEFGATL